MYIHIFAYIFQFRNFTADGVVADFSFCFYKKRIRINYKNQHSFKLYFSNNCIWSYKFHFCFWWNLDSQIDEKDYLRRTFFELQKVSVMNHNFRCDHQLV